MLFILYKSNDIVTKPFYRSLAYAVIYLAYVDGESQWRRRRIIHFISLFAEKVYFSALASLSLKPPGAACLSFRGLFA